MKFDRLTSLNEEAVKVASSIKVLEPLSWPKETEYEFLKAWNQQKSWDRQIEYPKLDYSEQRRLLGELKKDCPGDHPLEVFTRSTLDSYVAATNLVEAAGTTKIQTLSEQIFGKPGDQIPGTSITNLDAADRLTQITKDFIHPYITEPELTVPAEEMAAYLGSCIKDKMGDRGPTVHLIPGLAAKASASSRYIKLRAGTNYSRYDFDQLLEHEVMIHALTSLNGQNQKILKVMGRGSPRTTLTQEGLATFAEVITGSIDLRRLNRLALRIVAIDRALKGANFRETFQFFFEHGQSEKESFWSSARIFRGGQPDKNIIFTKDSVYLDGLIKVHTLFKWALANGRLGLTHLLFCGRLTIEDLFLLEESFKDGLINEPEFFPTWYERIEGFAGKLSFSFLAHEMKFEEVEEYFNRQTGS